MWVCVWFMTFELSYSSLLVAFYNFHACAFHFDSSLSHEIKLKAHGVVLATDRYFLLLFWLIKRVAMTVITSEPCHLIIITWNWLRFVEQRLKNEIEAVSGKNNNKNYSLQRKLFNFLSKVFFQNIFRRSRYVSMA